MRYHTSHAHHYIKYETSICYETRGVYPVLKVGAGPINYIYIYIHESSLGAAMFSCSVLSMSRRSRRRLLQTTDAAANIPATVVSALCSTVLKFSRHSITGIDAMSPSTHFAEDRRLWMTLTLAAVLLPNVDDASSSAPSKAAKLPRTALVATPCDSQPVGQSDFRDEGAVLSSVTC